MKALITPTTGAPFHLWWEDRVVADARSSVALRAVALLNGELDLGMSKANPGGTDSHWIVRGRLQTEDDFLLTVGSLIDQLDGIKFVELIGSR